MPRVARFELLAADPAVAIAFYERAFGWHFQPWGPGYWLATTGPPSEAGIDGALRRAPAHRGGATGLVLAVPDAMAAARRAQDAGGKVLAPKAPVAGVGWLVQVEDPAGNALGLLEDDPNAG